MVSIKIQISANEGSAAWDFPMKDSELADKLKSIGSGNKVPSSGIIWPKGLGMLRGLAVSMDELNFLAKSLERLNDSEYSQFMAAASLEKSPDLERLINLSFNVSRYTVIRDVSDWTGIGKRHLLNIQGISVHVDRELHAEITAYLQENNMKMGDFVALAAQELLRPTSMDIDPELKAEIDAYLEENNVTMDEFFAQAAQNQLHPQIPGIGTKLKTEINAYLEEHGMAMDEFIAMAAQDELHPNILEVEVKEMENMRTLAFQVPESLFQRVKQYLARNQMTQKAFVIGLIEEELDRDEELLRKQQEATQEDEEEEQSEAVSGPREAPVGEDSPEDDYDEPEESPAVADSEGEQEAPEEEQGEGFPGPCEAPAGEDSPEVEYGDEPEESPAVGDSAARFDEGQEEESDQDFSAGELEYAGETKGPEPDRPYVEGLLGAAVEVAPNFDYGQDEPPGFPDPDEEEDQEYGGMAMNM